MVLTKEYRICMPLTAEEYRIGQLYMIARHSHEQSDNDEGVEVVENVECTDTEYGKGRYTEKRIHLSSKLPYWIQSVLPRIFYVTEKAWNYYPFTITGFSDVSDIHVIKICSNNIVVQTCHLNLLIFFFACYLPYNEEYTCSFIKKFNISIKTRYEDNNGSTENCLGLSPIELIHREVDFVDIAYDEISAKHYKEEEDPKFFQSKRTGRGPLVEGWREVTQPIMCSYKLVSVSFELWGMQTRVEDFSHRCIRDILLLGHRQAFAWIDEWYDMTLEDVRKYEQKMQAETNEKVRVTKDTDETPLITTTPTTSVPASPVPASSTESANRSWFSWS